MGMFMRTRTIVPDEGERESERGRERQRERWERREATNRQDRQQEKKRGKKITHRKEEVAGETRGHQMKKLGAPRSPSRIPQRRGHIISYCDYLLRCIAMTPLRLMLRVPALGFNNLGKPSSIALLFSTWFSLSPTLCHQCMHPSLYSLNSHIKACLRPSLCSVPLLSHQPLFLPCLSPSIFF